MSDLTADLRLMETAARLAGKLAMEHWKTDLKIWDKTPGHPVTQVDLDVNTLLFDHLTTARPHYGWLSEETADNSDRLGKKRLFVVDPIDGTRAFMTGDPYFCIAIALLEDGIPIVGVVHAPAFDEMHTAIRGHGAKRNGTPISATDCPDVPDANMIGDAHMFAHPKWPTPWPRLNISNPKPNATAYRMVLVADGRWDGTIVLWRKGDWDVAAASLIVEEAGGRATTHEGDAFRFNRPVAAQKSLVAAGPYLHPLLIERCKHVRLPDPNESA